jgi:hypothetical protein
MQTAPLTQLEIAVGALESEEIDGLALADDLRALHRLQARFEAQVSRRVSVFDATHQWAADGSRSAAGWLVRHCRMLASAAHRRVKVARQLRSMPLVAAAWQSGAITTSHVEVLAKARHAAHADDRFAEMEAAFVSVAEAGTPEDVESVARQWRDALDAERQDMDSVANEQYESRYLDLSDILGGVMVLDGRADPEAASYIRRAIDREYERLHKQDDERTPGQQRMDALASMCRRDLSRQDAGSNRSHVMFLVDLPTFAGESVGVCETDRGVRLSPETMRRIACDSFISSALTDANSAVLDQGRAVRTFTPEQYRALLAQYPTCTGLGCTVPSSECQMHHVDWWDRNGSTDVGNGLPVCWHDHHLVHEQGWRVERDTQTGIVDWFRPDGTHAGRTQPRTTATPPSNAPKHSQLLAPLERATCGPSAGERELHDQQRSDRGEAEEVVSKDGVGAADLRFERLITGTEPDRARDCARGGQHDRTRHEEERYDRSPARRVVTHELRNDGAERAEHHERDEAVHRSSGSGDAPVVAGDRRKHLFGERALPMA